MHIAHLIFLSNFLNTRVSMISNSEKYMPVHRLKTITGSTLPMERRVPFAYNSSKTPQLSSLHRNVRNIQYLSSLY